MVRMTLKLLRENVYQVSFNMLYKIWKNFPQTSFWLSVFQTLLLLQDPVTSVSGIVRHVTIQLLARHFLMVMPDEPVQ